MWIAHQAPGFIAKLIAPNVPLSFLALAGCLPDAVFLVINLLPGPLRFETFNFDKSIVKKGGCFPYTNDYKYTHSAVGMGIIGIAAAFLYSFTARRKPSIMDQVAIFLTVMTHFPLELPVHRADVKLTPHDSEYLGSGLFDSPSSTLLMELAIFFAALGTWYAKAPLTNQRGARENPTLLKAVAGFFVVQQVHFCFGSAPTDNSRFVHAPIFLFEILFSSWLLGKLEDPEVDLKKMGTSVVDGVKNLNEKARIESNEKKA